MKEELSLNSKFVLSLRIHLAPFHPIHAVPVFGFLLRLLMILLCSFKDHDVRRVAIGVETVLWRGGGTVGGGERSELEY